MKKGYLYIVLTAFLFSTMEIALKITVGRFNPIQLTFLRFMIGSIILFPLAIRSLRVRGYRLERVDLGFFALTGFICVVVSMVLYQMAIVYTKASIVAVLFSCNPVFVVVFAYFLLHEPITRYTVVSIGLSILGILWIIDPLNFSGSPAGIGLALLSALTFGLYGVTGRKRSQRYGGFALTCFSFLFGCLELLLLIYLTRIDAVAAFLTRNGLQVFADIPLFQGLALRSLPSPGLYWRLRDRTWLYLLFSGDGRDFGRHSFSCLFYLNRCWRLSWRCLFFMSPSPPIWRAGSW